VPRLEFDVAAIHLHAPSPMRYIDNRPDSSRYVANGVSLSSVIGWAYDLQHLSTSLENSPEWTHTTLYDITAKSDAATDQYLAKLNQKDAYAEKRHMLQGLLADRFDLKIHPETKVSTIYELVTTPRTAELMTPVQGNVSKTISSCVPIHNSAIGIEVLSKGCPFTFLFSDIQHAAGTYVIDHTGMSGMYAYHLMSSDEGGTAPDGEERYPALMDAVHEQLGLELKRKKGLVTYWVVDSIEKPTPN
jgi:uncharacterized protein (TIGR03435 family)